MRAEEINTSTEAAEACTAGTELVSLTSGTARPLSELDRHVARLPDHSAPWHDAPEDLLATCVEVLHLALRTDPI